MPLTPEIFTRRALREARQGRSEEESQIHFDQALLLLPKAMDQLALETAMHPVQRASLTTRLAIGLTSGYADLAARPQILVQGLPFSEAYDGDLGEERNRLIWKPDAAALSQWLNRSFGYYALRQNRILTCKAGSASLTEMRSFILYTSYIPDFSNDFPLPDELEPRGLTIFAELLQPKA